MNLAAVSILEVLEFLSIFASFQNLNLGISLRKNNWKLVSKKRGNKWILGLHLAIKMNGISSFRPQELRIFYDDEDIDEKKSKSQNSDD